MIAAELESARKRAGLSQYDAAAICGVSPRCYWQWEAGISGLPVSLEGALARLKALPPKGKRVKK